MLRQDQNELLTRAGPGTPMGALFRSYWLPALLASELPENGCPPVRVKLLSERLIAWRDGNAIEFIDFHGTGDTTAPDYQDRERRRAKSHLAVTK